MPGSFTATIITGMWLLLTILLAISLVDIMPEDFMNRNYTGIRTKPHPVAQIAFLSIGGTFLFAYFTWTITPRISHYYDYLHASLLPLLAGWWFIALVIMGIIRQIPRKANGIRWAVAVGLVALVGIGFFVPTVKSISSGFLIKPYPITGNVTEKNSSTSKYGTTYTIVVDETVYKVTRRAYSELLTGETVELVGTEYANMAFPPSHVQLTWVGIILLIINFFSISSAIVIVEYRFIFGNKANKEEQ